MESSIVRPRQEMPSSSDGPRINEMINSRSVRCIDPDGEQLGILSIDDALNKAAELGLDLVELQPNAVPPVCKILDYGKHKYQAQKRANEARKKQKIIEDMEWDYKDNGESWSKDMPNVLEQPQSPINLCSYSILANNKIDKF